MIHNFIYYSDKPIVSPEFCNDLITKFEADDRKRKGSTGEENIVDDRIKASTDIHITSFPGYEEEHKILKRATMTQLTEYKKVLEELYPVYYLTTCNMKFPGFNMQRTLPGQYYHWHCDEDATQGGNGYMRGITYIIYLNDIHNDGYTEFFDKSRIKPRQGHCLLFPATWTYVHRGVPPIDETKYLCTGWCYYPGLVTPTDRQGNLRVV
jgi:hypothetical protein